MENDWRNKLSEGFENYSEAAPEGLWSAVSGTLSRQRRRRAFLAGACASFACAAAAALLLFRPESPTTSPQRLSEARTLVADIPLELPVAPAVPIRPEPRAVRSAGAAVPEAISEPLSEAEAVPEAELIPLPEESGGLREVPAPDISSTEEFDSDPFAEEPVPVGKRPGRGLALNLSFSGQGTSSSSAEGYGAMYGSGVSAALTSFSAPAGLAAAGPLPGVLLDNNFREVGTDTRHYQPVRFALSLAWEFAPSLSLVSGLGYSCLISDMSSGTRDSRYDIRQSLHYVGVPLSLNWSLNLAPRLDFYLSAGGMVEKCVYGQSVTSYIIDSRRQGQESSRIAVKPLQWSAKASAGLVWRFNPKLGAFIEPGLVRYFDNGSPVETLYGKKPLNFDLSLGLRVSL